MSMTLVIDDEEIPAAPGQTILEAAQAAGIYVPRLCHLEGLPPHGSCRVCTVIVDGRAVIACATPAKHGMIVENHSERLLHLRRNLIDMLFVEGNHLCMFCEASGRCELQALAYRFDIRAPRYPYTYPRRGLDASHPELLIDFDRCILCARCIQTSIQRDHVHALGFIGRGAGKRLAASSRHGLAGTSISGAGAVAHSCPVGALVPKHRGFDVPVGERAFDRQPIGAAIERARGDGEDGR